MRKITALFLVAMICFAGVANAEYYVKSGDTLYKIAKQYEMSLADLKSLNPHITNFNHIKPNDFIVVRKAGSFEYVPTIGAWSLLKKGCPCSCANLFAFVLCPKSVISKLTPKRQD
jgi:hypothetical protein